MPAIQIIKRLSGSTSERPAPLIAQTDLAPDNPLVIAAKLMALFGINEATGDTSTNETKP